MFPAVRMWDWVKSICKGKSSGPFIRGSKKSFVNGRPQVKLLDKSVPGIALRGSKSKFVEGLPAVRIIDKVKCGIIVKGSKDTFIGN